MDIPGENDLAERTIKAVDTMFELVNGSPL